MKRVAIALAFAACGGSQATPANHASSSPGDVAMSDVEAAHWLPAENDTVFAYATRDLVSGQSGVLSLRVRRFGADRVALLNAGRAEHLAYSKDGILREREGTYLIRTPVKEGATWPGGPNATFRVGKVDVRTKVPAGEFDHCAEIVEEKHGAIAGTITTTFCRDVGIVRIETKGQAQGIEQHDLIELTSYSKAIDVGPDGLRKIPTQ